MKKILYIIAALLIWGGIIILCGEKTEDATWASYYAMKGGGLAVILTSSFWLDTRLSRDEPARDNTKDNNIHGDGE